MELSFISWFIDVCWRTGCSRVWIVLCSFCFAVTVILLISKVVWELDIIVLKWPDKKESRENRTFWQCSFWFGWYCVWVTLPLIISQYSDSPLNLVSHWPFLLSKGTAVVHSAPLRGWGSEHTMAVWQGAAVTLFVTKDYWTCLKWHHNSSTLPVVITLHPSPFVPSGRLKRCK